jgi:predicted dehydrogenase
MNSLLIGCGSIGKRHLSKLIEHNQRIWVVDPNPETRNFAKSQSEQILGTYPDLREFLKENSDLKFNLIVISNWGPDHFETFKIISNLEAKKILIEKPLASKLNDLRSIETKLKDIKAEVFVNYHIRFDTGLKQLVNYSNTKNLGSPVSISISGGAKCISTTGIHWIDFTNFLIQSNWTKITASLKSSSINPRSSSLNFYQGFINVQFENSCDLNMNFTNHSYMDTQITIIWKKAKGILVNGSLEIYEPENEIPPNQPITRTVFFSKKTNEIAFFKDGLENFYDFIMGNTKGHMPNLTTANNILLTALIASKMNCSLTPESLIAESLADLDWRIS